MLIVLVSTISNSQIFFAEKNVSSFCKCTSIRVYAICNDQSFNGMLINDIVSFEQLSPEERAFVHSGSHTM